MILALVGVGGYLVYLGYGYLIGSGRIRDPARAVATVDRLFTEGNWFWGLCYATVSFSDAFGQPHRATLGMMRKAWMFLREGQKMEVTYSLSHPESALAGRGKGVYIFAGWGFIAAGAVMIVLLVYEFLSCTLGRGGNFWVR